MIYMKNVVCDIDFLPHEHCYPTIQTIKSKFTVQKTCVWVPYNSRGSAILTSLTWDTCITSLTDTVRPQKAGL